MTKSPKKSGKKTAGSKTTNRRRTYAVENVRVVSSIPFVGSNFETQFKKGLGKIAGTYNANGTDNLGYDLGTLETAVTKAGNDNATLVVAVGGLITGQAAMNVGTVPFLALTGGTVNFKDAKSGSFLGGICLDSYKHNSDRITNLMNKLSILADQICLLYNTNAAMSVTEQQQFTYSQNADIDPTNVNNASAIYTAAFDAIGQMTDSGGNPPGIQAIIVSADPFFTQTKEQLKAVAANYPYYIIYPLKEYKTGTAPKHRRATIHAPNDDLPTVYNKLGKKARAIVTGGSSTWDHEGLDNPDDQ
jgi:hypothetical protein